MCTVNIELYSIEKDITRLSSITATKMDGRAGWMDVWILFIVVVPWNGRGLAAPESQYQITFHEGCAQPALTTCPQDVSNPLPVRMRDSTQAPVTPELVITQFQGELVGNLSWKSRNLDKASVDNFYLRLTLAIKDAVEDVQCLNVSSPPSKNHFGKYCIIMVPDNFAWLFIDVILSHDPSCDCDITKMASEGPRHCGSCSLADPVVSSDSIDIGKRSCLKVRHQQEDDVKMRLSAWEITPDVHRFELYSVISNPFVEVEVFVHPEDQYNPAPLLHLYTTPNKYGQIYFNMASPKTTEKFFYAKLCLKCTEEDLSYQCYVTDVVRSEPVIEAPVTAMATQEYVEEPEGDDYPPSQDQYLIFGAVVGLLLVAGLVTVLVWARLVYLKRKKSRPGQCCRQGSMESNNSTAERSPLRLPSETSEDVMKENSSHPVYISLKTEDSRNMILYHPDSPTHQRAVNRLVEHLCMQSVSVEGLLQVQSFENWRDFAEKAGETYTNIIIVYSEGLHKLLTTYAEVGSLAGENRRTWENLLIERNQEYIPCVVLTKLKYLYQHGHRAFRLHFVLFDNQDGSNLTDLISQQFSFLRGNNFRVYSLPIIEADSTSQELYLQSEHSSVMSDLIQCLIKK